MSRILLIEDDPVLGRGISVNLELEGHHVNWVRSLKAAFEIHRKDAPDLVILDLGLPDGNGMEFCSALRQEGTLLPFIILTARTDEDSVVEGLSSGASDYIRKPFNNREFLARVRNALRIRGPAEKQVRFGELLILPEQRKVLATTESEMPEAGLKNERRELPLNRREFDILSFLVRHSNQVVTRESLLNALDRDGEMIDRTVDSHLSHIRSKLRRAGVSSLQIASVYGVGYRLEKLAIDVRQERA